MCISSMTAFTLSYKSSLLKFVQRKVKIIEFDSVLSTLIMGFTCIGLYSYETLSQAHAAPIKQTRKKANN